LRFEFTSNERNSFGCGRHFYTIEIDFILGTNRPRIKFFYTFSYF
jgi:hypothetical protein